jgi:hypothetical protein
MNWRVRKLLGLERKHKPGTFVMDIDWERSEELRVERLGPSPEDVPDPERIQVERWRPSRTLGPPYKH